MCNNMTNNPDMLTDRELEEVTAVFKSFETGLREATIHPKVAQAQRWPFSEVLNEQDPVGSGDHHQQH